MTLSLTDYVDKIVDDPVNPRRTERPTLSELSSFLGIGTPLYYNVKDSAYGALGDDSNDDTAEIQAAINACQSGGGGTVFFPPGIYRVTGLSASADDVHLLGSGMGATIIRMTSATGDTIATSGTINNFSVRNMTFDPSVTRTNSATANNEIKCPSFGTSQTGSTQSVFLSDLQFIDVNNAIFLGNASSASGRAFINNIHAYRFNRFIYLVRVLDGWFTNWSVGTDIAGATGIYIDGGCDGLGFINMDIINGITPGSSTGYGMHVEQSLHASPSRFIRCWGILLDSFNEGLHAVDGIDFMFDCCWFSSRPGAGISLSGSTDDYRFIGCDVYNCADNGMYIGGTGRVLIDGCSVVGNNTDNNATSVPGSAGIQLDQGSGGVTRISNLLAKNTTTFTGPQSYGVWIKNTAGIAFSILGGDVSGNAVGGINPLAGISSSQSKIISDVIGFRTENTGTDTVASGSTSKAVTHNLAVTPTVEMFQVTPTNNPTNNVRHWVSAVSSTTFTVSTSADPGASGLTFGWYGKFQ